MIEHDKGLRVKTVRTYLRNPDAKIGETVEIILGSFAGFTGTIVDVDGEWRSIEVPRA